MSPTDQLTYSKGFLTFSTFWISYAAVLIPGFGVMEAYAAVPEQIPKALGLYLFVWFITITSLMWVSRVSFSD